MGLAPIFPRRRENMSRITHMKPFSHEGLPDVTAYALTANLQAGKAQDLLVQVNPGGQVPLHSHSVDATMFIVDGEAIVISDDESLNGQTVHRGDVVDFERNIRHGFKASPLGLLFVSRNGGIIDEGSNAWDIQFQA
jgi:quercetin dioxygenase-like cupin family protein